MVKEYNLGGDAVQYAYTKIASDREPVERDYNEVVYITEGEGRMLDGTESVSFSRGFLAILPRGSRARLVIDGDGSATAHIIRFSDLALVADTERLFMRIVGEGRGVRYYTFPMLPTGALTIFDRLALTSRFSRAERQSYYKLMLSSLVFSLYFALPKPLVRSESDLGARVMEYIDMNMDSDLSLDGIAGVFFVSKCHLCRAFKRYSGRTVHAFISERRIALAHRLIVAGSTAADAAYKVGFGDYSAFYRAYVKAYGVSPTVSDGSLQLKARKKD